MSAAVFDMRAQRKWLAGVEQHGYDSLESCWEWMLGKSTAGYGYFRPIEGVTGIGVHRWTYLFFRGEIPEELHLDHLCRNRGCCNPWHLEPVTAGENVRRGEMRQKRIEAHQRTTACKRGHPWDEENGNTTRDSKGYRRCLVCDRMRKLGEI